MLEKISLCFESIMHLFRGLTIPVIPEDDELSGSKWDTGFVRPPWHLSAPSPLL